MSLLHGIVSTSLARRELHRRALPAWPAGTRVDAHDIHVEGRSLTDLARSHRTPCVLIPSAKDSDWSAARRTVVVSTITGRVEARRHKPVEITVDCNLHTLRAQCLHALLVNSPRALARTPMLIRSQDAGSVPLKILLPHDTSPGDLLAFACQGTIAASQTRLHDRPAESDEEEWRGRCMK